MTRTNKDMVSLSILACCWTVQVVIVFQQLLGLWHAPLLGADALLPEAVSRMAPKWDLLIYVLFIGAALGVGALTFRYYPQRVNYGLLIFDGAVTFLMLSAVYKTVIYDNSPQLAQRSLIALMVISVLSKFFYPEIKKFLNLLNTRPLHLPGVKRSIDIGWVAAIIFFIYMPDLQRVIAMIFIGDWLHHFDFLLMAPGWVALKGGVPFVEYGLGLPVIFAKVIHMFGAFDYEQALEVMMWFVIIYFILTYFLVRFWLKSALIAGVAFLLIFRLQMFHYGVSPLAWCTPSALPVRFGLDILWMGALLAHLRTRQSRWLVMAAVYSGFAVYYMTSVGMCVMVSFYAYLLGAAFLPDTKKSVGYYACWLLPIVAMFAFFGLTLKGLIFQAAYWHNMVDYMTLFEHYGSLPMFESLKYRHFWAFFMSMVVPFTYLATLLYIGIGLYLGRAPAERLLVAALCVYGLTNYQYYVVRSAITSYYVNVLPWIMVVCFWFKRGLEFVPSVWQTRLKAAALILSVYALLTNHNYLAYPNLMNFSRNPMTDNLVIQRFPDRRGFFNNQYKNTPEKDKLAVNDLGTRDEDLRTEDDFKNDAQLVDYYRQHFDFSRDAALIDRLTRADEKVALISSFETKILIEADRAPLFYHFCMLSSRPMTFRSLPYAADTALTPDFLKDTFKQLRENKPEYIFLENVFLEKNVPDSYVKDDTAILALAAYVKTRYAPFEKGQYLTAMKRTQESR